MDFIFRLIYRYKHFKFWRTIGFFDESYIFLLQKQKESLMLLLVYMLF